VRAMKDDLIEMGKAFIEHVMEAIDEDE